ncbi:MAG TPA: hypothetical protein VLS96_05220 [Nodosilinea sp.]|nr:hypothetical protein [Nodosilinea sp.]
MFLEYIAPRSQASRQAVSQYLEPQQAAQAFRLEVEHRTNLEAYCQWYDQVSHQHRQELAQMQLEINLRAWFSGRST